jgi:PAS domain S-box-containing protein
MSPNQNSINLTGDILGDILIVDDEIPNLQLLTQLLSEAGYQVRPAKRPQLAIESALAQPPSLILLDVRMPEMDGFEVCRRLKQEEQTRDIPVIFVSALQDVQDRIRGFEAGGVDFISKPFQELEVMARVQTHLALRDMQLRLEDLVAMRTAELTATNKTLEVEISQRKRATEELVKSEAKYRGLVDTSLVGVFHTRINGQIIFVNDALARMFDFNNPEQMVVEEALSRWADPNRRELFLTTLRKQGYVSNFETESITHTGRHIHVLFSATLNSDNISGMVMDITDRKRAEQKIIDYQQRLKALASQLTIVEEKERRRLAADLHDRVCQTLALANIQLDSARKSTSESKLADKLDDTSDTLLETLKNTKQLMLELSSSSMHEIGLSSAISEWLEVQIGNRHSLKTEFIDNLPHNRKKTLDSNVQTILFRNVRELLVNVVKHARANKVSARIEDRSSNIRIIVEDDGIGFEPRAVIQAGSKTGGFGLFSIEELMADLGGSLRIVSEPGEGCTAILSAPFSVDDSRERD